VQKASQIRVAQVNEDIPWVKTAIEPLRNLQVPIEQQDIIDRWTKAKLCAALAAHDDSDDSRTGPVHPDNPAKLIEELTTLGIMTRRANGKVDLPDVYRIAFDLGRKGGVPRVRT
jgi:hypothetical protein